MALPLGEHLPPDFSLLFFCPGEGSRLCAARLGDGLTGAFLASAPPRLSLRDSPGHQASREGLGWWLAHQPGAQQEELPGRRGFSCVCRWRRTEAQGPWLPAAH